MTDVTHSELQSILDGIEHPQVDISKLLGVSIPVYVAVSDIDRVIALQSPTYKIGIGNAWVSFETRDGGFMVTMNVIDQ